MAAPPARRTRAPRSSACAAVVSRNSLFPQPTAPSTRSNPAFPSAQPSSRAADTDISSARRNGSMKIPQDPRSAYPRHSKHSKHSKGEHEYRTGVFERGASENSRSV
ncbi:hypothetical protein ADK93_21110 [Streptomyces sp. XY58]|nr:hypothetical protein VR43_10710 [Streptomyces sp. NRRL S-104]KOU85977.1 hypothetical protein ADK93_21110 [Streptomyces sp. XY58]KOV51302.1 hypothetical protein ADK99_08935 [Streptomyces sp. MMG1064]